MYHYCEECFVNGHCIKCCPYSLEDIQKIKCNECGKMGHPKSCCPKGTLKYMEQNYNKKLMKRQKFDEEDEMESYELDPMA